ncbi:hypothetical protein ACFL6O_05575 [candidate division KSB1 bacterium]
MRYRALTIFVFMLVCISCGSDPENATIETVDGVEYISNHEPVWGEIPDISLEFVLRIGEMESADENYQLFKPVDVDVDSKGNIYVLEAGNCRIQKYSPEGKYIATFGGEGLGPGEFKRPQFLTIRDDMMYVRESSSEIIKVLDVNGREVRRIDLKKSNTRNYGSTNVIVSSDFSLTASNRVISKISDENNMLAILGVDGSIVNTFAEKRAYEAADEDETLVIIFPDLMNRMSFSTDGEDCIYAVFHNQNRIEKYSQDGELLFQIKSDRDYPETTELEKEMREMTMTINGREVKYEDEMPKYNTFWTGVQLDEQGRIWTAAYIRQKSDEEKFSEYMRLGIFEPSGRLLGYLTFPENSSSTFRIIGDSIYFIDKNESMCVYQYRIDEK